MSQRHQLMFLTSDAHFVISDYPCDKQQIDLYVSNWIAKERPFFYTSQAADNAVIKLGLPAWLQQKKYRISLTVNRSAIKQEEALPTLEEIEPFFYQKWGIKPLINIDKAIRVYGSFLMQKLSGLPFVNQDSDLDILLDHWQYNLPKLTVLIEQLTNHFQRAIDGEVRFANLGEIAIKELLDKNAQSLLVKKADSLQLITRNELYDRYPHLCN